MDAKERMRETAEKIKAGQQVDKQEEALKEEAAKTELELIRNNSALASMYQSSSKVGSENLGGETPQLKIHSVGRSQNELADGKEPLDGYFFYKPTGEQFESVNCHVLTISKGFRAAGFGEENKNKEVFNQILGGVIIDNGDYKPFIMYFTGLKLSYLWEFGKVASKYTKARPMNIPMFAMTVKLSTEKIPTDYGKSWVVNFEIVKNSDNSPKLISDETTFVYIRNQVEAVEDMISALIEAKAINKEEPIPVREVETVSSVEDGYKKAVEAEEPAEPIITGREENVEVPGDLPF